MAFASIMIMAVSCNHSAESPACIDGTQVIDSVMASRRSIRKFTSRTVSRDTIDKILKAGIIAPNGMNRQAYELRVVDDPELLSAISDACSKDGKHIFNGAPCVVFIANDTTYDMSQVDCGLLGENMILSAWSMGIGSCCMARPVRMMLDTPACAPYVEKLGFSDGFSMLYSIVFGYPDETPAAKPRTADRIRFVECE